MAVRKLKHIRQSLSTSCGPACLAILARETESEAIKAIFAGRDPSEGMRTRWPQLRRGMSKLRLRFEDPVRRVSDWSRIPETAIVGCGKRKDPKGRDIWHWVVYQSDGNGSGLVYDPERAVPYVPNGRHRKPFSYLPVVPRL